MTEEQVRAVSPTRLSMGMRLHSLDGIRALAVTAVLLYHAGIVRGGYLGVDLFFVLSGFLITIMLCEERRKTGRVSLAAFWFRRAFRLLPALLVYLAAGLAASMLLKPPADQRQYDLDATTAVLGVNNWWRVRGGDAASGAWDGHLWSLSVEAQFYVVWPVLLTAVILVLRGRARWLVLGGLIVAVAAWRAVLMTGSFVNDADTRTYFGTDTRADALLIGAALGLLWQEGHLAQISLRVWRWASLAACAALLVAMSLSPILDDRPRWLAYGGFTAVALLASLVVGAAVLAPDSALPRVFALRPLAWLGGISYAMYLWHFPITIELEGSLGPRIGAAPAAVLAFGMSVALGWGSTRFVERPVARLRRYLEARRTSQILPSLRAETS